MDHSAGTTRSASRRDEGVALILSLFFTIIVAGVVVTGSIILKSNRQATETSFRVNGQANQFARSGIVKSNDT